MGRKLTKAPPKEFRLSFGERQNGMTPAPAPTPEAFNPLDLQPPSAVYPALPRERNSDPALIEIDEDRGGPSSLGPWASTPSTQSSLSLHQGHSTTSLATIPDRNLIAGNPSPSGSSTDLMTGQTKGTTGSPNENKRNWVAQNFSLTGILNILDFRDYFWPMTWKKYLGLFGLAACIAGIIMSNYYTGWIYKSMAITKSYMLPVLVIVVCFEPAMVTMLLFIAKVPDLPAVAPRSKPLPQEINEKTGAEVASDLESGFFAPLPPTAPSNETSFLAGPDCSSVSSAASDSTTSHNTALVIPCHNSDRDVLKRVLESAYPHFRPKDIFIVDNGRSQYPNDMSFREWLREQNPEIVYMWSPIGSKNAAQFVGSLAARDYSYIMTVDDDVSIPATFTNPTELITDSVKGVAFPLKATNSEGKVPLFLVGWQDCEYRMSGLCKMAESRVSGVSFPHGAGWFIERDSFVKMLGEYHPMDFISEDVNAGLSFMRMGKMIACDARCILETEVPDTFFGPGLNWWSQRYKSWEMGRHGQTVRFLRRLFLSLNGQRTIQGILLQKFMFVYMILSNALDWLRIPVLVALGSNWLYWIATVGLAFAAVVPVLAYNYIKCRRRPDLQCGFWAAVTYPVYKQIYCIVSIFGAIRCVAFYVGGHVPPKTITQMLKTNDERCFWLDPRFESNPAFLADEAEEMFRAKAAAANEAAANEKSVPIVTTPPAPTWSPSSWSLHQPSPPRSQQQTPQLSPHQSPRLPPSPPPQKPLHQQFPDQQQYPDMI